MSAELVEEEKEEGEKEEEVFEEDEDSVMVRGFRIILRADFSWWVASIFGFIWKHEHLEINQFYDLNVRDKDL